MRSPSRIEFRAPSRLGGTVPAVAVLYGGKIELYRITDQGLETYVGRAEEVSGEARAHVLAAIRLHTGGLTTPGVEREAWIVAAYKAGLL
jgi:hypothetical protein